MEDQIKVGDVVRPKSGGPRMVVYKIGPWNGVIEADCEWVLNGKKETGSFALTSLKFAEQEASSAAVAGLSGTPWS
jgi:uncharacterized protein YodC (DUF2158 family)